MRKFQSFTTAAVQSALRHPHLLDFTEPLSLLLPSCHPVSYSGTLQRPHRFRPFATVPGMGFAEFLVCDFGFFILFALDNWRWFELFFHHKSTGNRNLAKDIPHLKIKYKLLLGCIYFSVRSRSEHLFGYIRFVYFSIFCAT